MAFTFDVRDLLKTGRELTKTRQRQVHLQVLVEVDAPEGLLASVEAELSPSTSRARIAVDVVAPGVSIPSDADAIVVLLGPVGSKHTEDMVLLSLDRGVPVVGVSLGGDRPAVSLRSRVPMEDVLIAQNPATLVGKDLGAWLVDRLDEKRLALAANFAFVRRAVAEHEVRATALQNAAIGAVVFLPGADMPLLTLNQAKMLLRIGAAYGQALGGERIKELAAVVGAGFLLRTVARQVVALVPGFGWAVKGGIAYGGTVAMGRTATAYFEEGADLAEVGRRLAAEGKRKAGSLRRVRGRAPAEGRERGALTRLDPGGDEASS